MFSCGEHIYHNRDDYPLLFLYGTKDLIMPVGFFQGIAEVILK